MVEAVWLPLSIAFPWSAGQKKSATKVPTHKSYFCLLAGILSLSLLVFFAAESSTPSPSAIFSSFENCIGISRRRRAGGLCTLAHAVIADALKF
jgi:hypothetical protein